MSIPIRIIRAEFGRFHTPHTWKKNKTEYRIFLDGVRFAEKLFKMGGMIIYDKPRIP